MALHAYPVSSLRPLKRLIVVVLLVLVASVGYRFYGSPQTGTGALTLPQPAPNEGENAPVLEAGSEEGGPFEVSDEGVYVIAFWSGLNRDTEDARPEFERMAEDYEDEGVSFAAVYVPSAPESEDYVPYEVLQDVSGEMTALYNVKRVPRLFVIRDGKIEYVQNGYYLESEDRLREKLDGLL